MSQENQVIDEQTTEVPEASRDVLAEAALLSGDEAVDASTESNETSETAKTDANKRKRRRKKPELDSETIMNLQKGQHMVGKVKNITEFGAFVDLGIAQDGLIHISQLARHKVEAASEVVSEGQEVEVWVKKVDKKRGRISLTMIKPVKLRLKDIKSDDELEGVVTRLESYGAFVDIESEREGLVHISEITHEYINHPQEILAVGSPVKIKVLKVDQKKRQVDLSIKALLPPPPPKEVPPPAQPRFVVQEARPPQRPAQPKPEAIIEINEDEPMMTAMGAAFSMFQEGNEGASFNRKGSKNRNKRGNELEGIINRTLNNIR